MTDLVAYLEALGPGKGKFGGGVAGPVRLPEGFQLTLVATGLSGDRDGDRSRRQDLHL